MALYDIKCISSRPGRGYDAEDIVKPSGSFGFLFLANALPSEMMKIEALIFWVIFRMRCKRDRCRQFSG